MSKGSGGQPPNNSASYASISLDGRFVAFYTQATNFPGNAAGENLVYARGPLRR